MRIRALSVVAVTVGGAACSFPTPSLNTGNAASGVATLESALDASTLIGFSSTLAMAAMSTGTANCATVVTACSSYPCSGAVDVALGASCPLPLGGVASGTIHVTGTWQDVDTMTLTSVYTSVDVNGGSSLVASTTNIAINVSGSTVSSTYVGQDVSVQGQALQLADQSTWTVQVDTASTPGDPTDDSMTISGAQQSAAGSGSTSQLTLGNTTIVPACHLNPVDGVATWQDISGGSINQQVLEFHSTCDGQADLLIGQTGLVFYP